MNLAELSAAIDAAVHVRRLETLPAYRSSSDVDWVQRYLDGSEPPDPAAKQPWLARLREAADHSRPRERLRVVPVPVPDYVRYACEWGYVDNAHAGEVVRVLDAVSAPDRARAAEAIGDVYLLDGQVVVMNYGDDGGFRDAHHAAEDDASVIRRQVDALWAVGEDFVPWWTMRDDLHRDVHT